MNAGRKLFSRQATKSNSDTPRLVVPELVFPKASVDYSTLRMNAENLKDDVQSVIDSIRELQKDSAILSGMYALLNDAVIRVSEKGIISDVNDSAEKMFCVNYKDVIGKSIELLLGCGTDSSKLKELSEKEPSEYRLKKSSEHIEYFDASISVTSINHLSKHDGMEFIVIVRDISDVTKMRRALSETDIKFEALYKALDEASDVIIITDKQNKIIFVNRAFTLHTGYSFEETVGQNPGFYKSGDLPHSFYDDLWAHLSQRHVWQGMLLNKHKNGNLLYDQTIITPVMNGDPKKPAYYIAVKQIGANATNACDGRQLQLRLGGDQIE